MTYNIEKVDEAALALLYLTLHNQNRVWKGLSWDVMDRLYEKGFITNPQNKNKSVELTEDGVQKAQELFAKLFE